MVVKRALRQAAMELVWELGEKEVKGVLREVRAQRALMRALLG